MTRSRWLRRILVSVVGLAVVASVGGCGDARTPDAFCGVMDKHKERYLAAMSGAGDSAGSGDAAGVVGGLVQAIGALGDLQAMWRELADVAPEEIRVDVETLRDENARQLEKAREHVAQPLAGLGSAIVGALTTSGSAQRVDTYVREHC